MIKKRFILISVIIFMITIAFSAKAVSLQSGEESNKRFQEAKQNYLNQTNEYKNAKQLYIEIKTRFQDAGEEQQGQLREQLRERSKNFLENSVSAMIKYLEAMRNKVSNANNIFEDDRQIILADIDKEISWLGIKKSEIKNATDEQLKQIKETVLQRWINIRVAANKITGQIIAARIRYVIEKAELMADKLEVKINEFKQSGKDVASLEALMVSFEDKIKLSKLSYEQAKAKFQAISGKEGAGDLLRQGHKLLKDARQYLNQAYKDLRQIVVKIKQLENSQTKQKNATSTQ